MSWYLDSVYERNKESPNTFYVPSKEVIEMLNIGDIVKLIIVETENDGYVGERMVGWSYAREELQGDTYE